ncbi:MAG: hypothetical protein ACLQGP_11445, partial [Isosphaeraceae bacterium]
FQMHIKLSMSRAYDFWNLESGICNPIVSQALSGTAPGFQGGDQRALSVFPPASTPGRSRANRLKGP